MKGQHFYSLTDLLIIIQIVSERCFIKYTGCSGKIVFFHNSLQPLPLAYGPLQEILKVLNNVQLLQLTGNLMNDQ